MEMLTNSFGVFINPDRINMGGLIIDFIDPKLHPALEMKVDLFYDKYREFMNELGKDLNIDKVFSEFKGKPLTQSNVVALEYYIYNELSYMHSGDYIHSVEFKYSAEAVFKKYFSEGKSKLMIQKN